MVKKMANVTLGDGLEVSASELPDPDLLSALGDPPEKVLFFDGTLSLGDDDLDLDALEGVVVVAGDLVTKGDVVNLELDSGSALVVAGALKARNLVVGGARVHVRGALALKNTLLGLGESGSVHVAGNLDARAVFLGGFDFSFGARLRAPVMDYVAENAAADFGPADDFKALIQRDVLVDGDVDVANLIRRVRLSGKTPLTSTANPSRVIIEKAIKKFVDKGKPALEIDRTLTGHDSYNKHV